MILVSPSLLSLVAISRIADSRRGSFRPMLCLGQQCTITGSNNRFFRVPSALQTVCSPTSPLSQQNWKWHACDASSSLDHSRACHTYLVTDRIRPYLQQLSCQRYNCLLWECGSQFTAVTTLSNMATASLQDLPIVEPAHLKNLDPPMVAAPYPAGFPMREDSPRLLSEFDVTERSIRQVSLTGGHEREACTQIWICPHSSELGLSYNMPQAKTSWSLGTRC